VRFVRLAVKVVMENDGDFLDVILLYHARGYLNAVVYARTVNTRKVVLRRLFNAARRIPYILESNAHPFYSFGGLKNQMRVRFAGGLDSRSRAGFWKND
jgi:hypothetical protein